MGRGPGARGDVLPPPVQAPGRGRAIGGTLTSPGSRPNPRAALCRASDEPRSPLTEPRPPPPSALSPRLTPPSPAPGFPGWTPDSPFWPHTHPQCSLERSFPWPGAPLRKSFPFLSPQETPPKRPPSWKSPRRSAELAARPWGHSWHRVAFVPAPTGAVLPPRGRSAHCRAAAAAFGEQIGLSGYSRSPSRLHWRRPLASHPSSPAGVTCSDSSEVERRLRASAYGVETAGSQHRCSAPARPSHLGLWPVTSAGSAAPSGLPHKDHTGIFETVLQSPGSRGRHGLQTSSRGGGDAWAWRGGLPCHRQERLWRGPNVEAP